MNIFERMKMNYRTIFVILLLIAVTGLFGQSITVRATYPGFTNSQACAAYGDYIYILDYYNVYAYSTLSGTFVDTLNLGEYVRQIDFYGTQAVVVGISNIYLIDISTPSAMSALGSLSVGVGSMGWDVALNGSMVYVAAQNRAFIAEITGTSLTYRGEFLPFGFFPMVRCIEINGTTMFVGDGNGSLYAVDVTNPASPSIRMTAATPGSKIDLEVLPGNKLVVADGAYVGMDSTSIRIFNIATPTTLTELGAWVQFGGDAIETHTPAPHTRTALADGEGGVKIIDISTPADPYLVVSQATSDLINGIFVRNDTLFVAGMSNFYIMTTDAFGSDTDTVITHIPAIIDSVRPSGTHISSCEPYFEWFYTPGSNPINTSSVVIEVNGTPVDGSDPRVFFDSGVISIDLGSSSYSTFDTSRATLTFLEDVAGSLAVGLGLWGSVLLDFDSPILGEVSPSAGEVVHRDSVEIVGTVAEIGPSGLDEAGFRIIVNGISYSPSSIYLDFTPPTFVCTPMGSFSPGSSVEICILAADMPEYCDPNVLDTCWTFFIRATGITDERLPEKFTAYAYPNPFNSAVSIHFANIPEGSDLSIFDIRGNIVGKIASSEFKNNRTVWTPPDEAASGIYFACFPGGEILRITLLR